MSRDNSLTHGEKDHLFYLSLKQILLNMNAT